MSNKEPQRIGEFSRRSLTLIEKTSKHSKHASSTSPCPDCGGSGCDCALIKSRRDDRESIARACGVPSRFRNAEKGSTDLPEGGSAFFSGQTGRGKTWTGSGILIEYAITHPKAVTLWRRSCDIMLELKASFDNPRMDESTLIDKYRKADLLLIDELGAEKVSDWSISAFYSILAGRYDDMRSTIITSNLGLGELREWHPRIASRIGSFEICLVLSGRDRRLEKKT